MALLVSVPGAATTQPWGMPARGVASKEPAMWSSGDKAYWLSYPGATFHEHFHPGVDRADRTGSPILAIEAGTVIFSGWRNSVSGNAIHVEIRPGTRYGFGHCSKLLIAAGGHVTRGQTIALIGSTGVATGPHTHSFVSIKEKGADGVLRTFIHNPTLFEPGGKLAEDPRIAPLAAGPAALVTLKGPGINIRTTPDLDAGASNVYATSRADGIFRGTTRIHANVFTGFAFLRELTNDDGAWVEVFGFKRVLYLHRSLVNIH